MALVSSTDFDALPIDPVSRWLHLRDLLERRLVQSADAMEGISEENLAEYCTVLINAAEELKLAKFESFSVMDIRQQYPGVRSEIIGLATRLSMRTSTANAALSVALPRTSKTKLYSQLERLRALSASADISESQRKKLYAKLDELHTIITAPRTDFAKLMGIIAFIAVSVNQTTAFLADAPDALTTIAVIVGEAKEAEEQEYQLLQSTKEPLKLEDLRDGTVPDDEIPF